MFGQLRLTPNPVNDARCLVSYVLRKVSFSRSFSILKYMKTTNGETDWVLTPVARMKRRHDAITYVEVTPGIEQTPLTARENLEAAMKLAGNERLPLLLDLRGAVSLTTGTRRVYSGIEVGNSFCALAILTHVDLLSRTMGQIYLRFANLPIPTKIFIEPVAALEWLHKAQTI